MTVAAAGVGSLAAGAAGALIAIVAALDLFLTVFNYDGYTFISGRFQRALWRFLRGAARLLPQRGRHTALSIGSAAMLPATFAMWLGLEITGFALMYWRGISAGGFALKGTGASLGAAFYLSASGISSLTFGDAVPRGGLERALVDLETILGLATFTLALGYVVTAFGVLGALENLHGQVRRHATELSRPSSILARRFQGGQSGDLPAFLQALGDDLETYDQGLRATRSSTSSTRAGCTARSRSCSSAASRSAPARPPAPAPGRSATPTTATGSGFRSPTTSASCWTGSPTRSAYELPNAGLGPSP